MTKSGLIEQDGKFLKGQHPVTGKMLGRNPQHGRDCSIPEVVGVQREAEEAATRFQYPVDAGQHCLLIEHVLESADADRQIDRLVCDTGELLGITHLKGKIGFAWGAPKSRARQFDHSRRHVDPDASMDFRSEGEEVMTVAATDVQNDVTGPRPGQVSHKFEPVFEQPLRRTMLLGRSRRGAIIKEGLDVRGGR